MTDKTGTTARTYDEENRVITKKAPGFGTTTYTYDNSEGGGLYSETAEDFKHNLTKKVYDKAGRLYEVISGKKTTTYEYYGNGSRKTVTYSDGAKEEYTYYKDGLNKTLTNKKADGTVIDTYSYTYDEAHNQTTKTDRKGTTSYNYDSLNRLEKVTEPNGRTTGYTFDKAGNRLTETILAGAVSVTTTYTYNEQNRLVSTVKRSGAETITDTYRFDNNGNIVSKTAETVKPVAASVSGGFSLEKSGQSTTSNVTNYKFDVWNQLVKTTAGKKTATYSYNAEGYRVSKTENERTTNYLYEADKVVLETDVEGNETARNIYGLNLLTRTAQNDTMNYMYNGHGDVTALVGENGAIQATYYYDAFGNITEQTGDVNNNITYAGYQYDKETDLYYLNARYYDSKTARFLSEDTYTGNTNDPLSLNLYTYCLNNPITYTDPTGHHASGQRLSYSQEYNSDVAELQKKLIAIGAMSPVPQNQIGLFGPKTEKAVNEYKNKYLPSGNKGNNEGVVGDTTWAYIDRDYSKMTNSRQYQNQALIYANNNTDSNFNNTLKNLKNTNSPTPKPSSQKPSSVKTSPNKGTGNSEVIIPEYLYDAEKDKWLSNSSQYKLADLTLQWYESSSQSDKDSILKIIRLARIDINDSRVDEALNYVADKVIDEIFGGSVLGEFIARATGSSSMALDGKKDVIEQAKLAYVLCSVMNTNFKDIANTKSPSQFIKELENAGWKKTVEPGGGKSGPATILTDTKTGIKVRVQESPINGNPYFRVQNKGGNYLEANGSFPSNATKQEMRNLTHFEFKIKIKK